MTYRGFTITLERGLYKAVRQGEIVIATTKDELFEILDHSSEG